MHLFACQSLILEDFLHHSAVHETPQDSRERNTSAAKDPKATGFPRYQFHPRTSRPVELRSSPQPSPHRCFQRPEPERPGLRNCESWRSTLPSRRLLPSRVFGACCSAILACFPRICGREVRRLHVARRCPSWIVVRHPGFEGLVDHLLQTQPKSGSHALDTAVVGLRKPDGEFFVR